MTINMTAESLQSEPSAIHPYIVLSTYRLLVCQVCGFASVAEEVATHLRTRHRDIQPQHRQDLVEKIKRIPDVFRSRDEIRRYLQYPTDLIQPIPYLAPPEPDGLKCRTCGHIVRRHQWIDPRGRGRPAPNCPVSAYELPWEEHTKGRAGGSKVKSSTKKPQETPRLLTSEASTHLQQVIDREARYREALGQPRSTTNDTGTDTFAATSLWLDRTQWPSIYRGSRRDVLRALIRLPDRHALNADYILGQGSSEGAPNIISPREDEQKISCIMRALDSVIDRCEDTVRCTSHNLHCWLLSSRLHSRREIAFNLVAEKSSEIKYRRTQKQFLAFVLRVYRMPDGSRREMMNVKLKPEISKQLDQIWEHNIWNHLDVSKGTWPVMKRQGSSMVGIYSNPTGVCQGPGRKGSVTDGETDDENDNEDNQSDYDDSGGYTARTYQDLLPGPSSTLLIYFSDILRFFADAIIYIQRMLFLKQFEYFDEYPNNGEIITHGTAELNIDLSRVKDDIISTKSGYSFVNYPENVYVYTAGRNGLAKDGIWTWHAITAYLKQVSKIEDQTLRIRELLSLKYENGPNTMYVICHYKAKRLTNREFYIIRFLLCLQTQLLFQNNRRPWLISHLTDIIIKATLELHNDCSNDTDINAIYTWQSGHRPLQHGITYRLNKAYLSRLQLLLLRYYNKNILSEPKRFPVLKLSLINKKQKGSRPLVILNSQDQVPSVSGEIPLQDIYNENGNLASINGVLYVLNKPRLLICLLYRHAIQPRRGIKAHFRNIHKYTGNKLKLSRFSYNYCEFLSINNLNVRNHYNQCKGSSVRY
ncbi:hypothetical protein BKA59DRAFT_536212 [Fusarium tricinctum]|uniref:Uncharacterized protein n=1 Tax=Fusarium tricinctum TaxID=61284 RepID=A0A8K0RJW6_9HYPO|nr:hypothetical protein BKA59DRAFT_536212 [Fusarium tricinctum]